jgi:hypothetical protein
MLNAGTLDVVRSVLSSTVLSDIARTELDAIECRLVELASGLPNPPNTNVRSPYQLMMERLLALLLSIFPEPEESRWIESVLGQGTNFPSTTVCQFIRERLSQ